MDMYKGKMYYCDAGIAPGGERQRKPTRRLHLPHRFVRRLCNLRADFQIGPAHVLPGLPGRGDRYALVIYFGGHAGARRQPDRRRLVSVHPGAISFGSR